MLALFSPSHTKMFLDTDGPHRNLLWIMLLLNVMFHDTDSILTWLKYTSRSLENIGVYGESSTNQTSVITVYT